jgi:hypothetical protein
MASIVARPAAILSSENCFSSVSAVRSRRMRAATSPTVRGPLSSTLPVDVSRSPCRVKARSILATAGNPATALLDPGRSSSPGVAPRSANRPRTRMVPSAAKDPVDLCCAAIEVRQVVDHCREPDDVDACRLQGQLFPPAGAGPDRRGMPCWSISVRMAAAGSRAMTLQEAQVGHASEDPGAGAEVEHLKADPVWQERGHCSPPLVQHAVRQTPTTGVRASGVRLPVVHSGHRPSIPDRRSAARVRVRLSTNRRSRET